MGWPVKKEVGMVMVLYSPANGVWKLVYWCGLKEVGWMATEKEISSFCHLCGKKVKMHAVL